MLRVIVLNGDIVKSVKEVKESYVLKENEIFSEVGEAGQRRLENGTFEDVPAEPIEEVPSIEETILYETQYQTILLEMISLGGI